MGIADHAKKAEKISILGENYFSLLQIPNTSTYPVPTMHAPLILKIPFSVSWEDFSHH